MLLQAASRLRVGQAAAARLYETTGRGPSILRDAEKGRRLRVRIHHPAQEEDGAGLGVADGEDEGAVDAEFGGLGLVGGGAGGYVTTVAAAASAPFSSTLMKALWSASPM